MSKSSRLSVQHRSAILFIEIAVAENATQETYVAIFFLQPADNVEQNRQK